MFGRGPVSLGPIDLALASVELREDGSYWLKVTDDAPSQKSVAIEAMLRPSERCVTSGSYIYRASEQPLVAFWRQEAPDGLRQPGELIRELHFDPVGRFTVTWQSFETNKDYWGHCRLDKATGQFELQVNGGNIVPGTVRSGTQSGPTYAAAQNATSLDVVPD